MGKNKGSSKGELATNAPEKNTTCHGKIIAGDSGRIPPTSPHSWQLEVSSREESAPLNGSPFAGCPDHLKMVKGERPNHVLGGHLTQTWLLE